MHPGTLGSTVTVTQVNCVHLYLADACCPKETNVRWTTIKKYKRNRRNYEIKGAVKGYHVWLIADSNL